MEIKFVTNSESSFSRTLNIKHMIMICITFGGNYADTSGSDRHYRIMIEGRKFLIEIMDGDKLEKISGVFAVAKYCIMGYTNNDKGIVFVPLITYNTLDEAIVALSLPIELNPNPLYDPYIWNNIGTTNPNASQLQIHPIWT